MISCLFFRPEVSVMAAVGDIAFLAEPLTLCFMLTFIAVLRNCIGAAGANGIQQAVMANHRL
jgi:hypothetical protein